MKFLVVLAVLIAACFARNIHQSKGGQQSVEKITGFREQQEGKELRSEGFEGQDKTQDGIIKIKKKRVETFKEKIEIDRGYAGGNTKQEGGLRGQNGVREGHFGGSRQAGGFGENNGVYGGHTGGNTKQEGGFEGNKEVREGHSGGNRKEGSFGGHNRVRAGHSESNSKQEGAFGGYKGVREGHSGGNSKQEGSFGGYNGVHGGHSGGNTKKEGGFLRANTAPLKKLRNLLDVFGNVRL